jgi:hypothetical protein
VALVTPARALASANGVQVPLIAPTRKPQGAGRTYQLTRRMREGRGRSRAKNGCGGLAKTRKRCGPRNRSGLRESKRHPLFPLCDCPRLVPLEQAAEALSMTRSEYGP